ncbi:monoamine oxidase N [Microdochium trichocladiopsis]|uniref:Amine oxidase n=1 Tax=Microdochium trichocladiopsis TaxID=1682393 RepID=A0A9P8XU63_9PEZI|nr:monoamine oxidase N [Microdochium trichocladiopsis]KAH7017965.1 monoamine oxidase N [Microdochium trichocladiopsis]
MASKDGFSWTESQGLKAGVPCIGAIQPPTNLNDDSQHGDFDVIVVGAGYAGLTAVRDASIAGLKVLLLEARDRIGGRSWSSNIEGYPYEMGGTWVYWNQTNVWREIARYGMQDELEESYDFSKGIDQFLLSNAQRTQSFSHADEDALMKTALEKLVNVDGNLGKTAVPFPHSAKMSAAELRYDRMTLADRINELRDELTPNERLCVEAFVLLCSGATLETASLYEFLHWWALCDYTYDGLINYLVRYKFHGGQSSFAIRFFREALATGNLRYAFEQPVAAIKQLEGVRGGAVEVQTRAGRSFRGRRAICAVPLNVLDNVAFSPPLSPGKRAAASRGHVNQCVKVHAEVSGTHLRSVTAISYPHHALIYSLGDGTTPAGNAHIVAFGAQHNHFEPDEDVARAVDAFRGLAPAETDMCVRRLVFHNWSKDEYAKGAWFFPPPGLLADHLADMRAPHGHVFFACSDWALGWRSFIDGAIQEGARAVVAVTGSLAGTPSL